MAIASLDIDLTEGEGAQLAAAVVRADPALAQAQKLLTRTFLLRSDWAPGLCFVGAQATYGNQNFSVGGGGLSIERATASCLGEAAERVSQIERPGDVLHRGSDARVLDSTRGLIELIAPEVASHDADWIAGVDLHGQTNKVPADWCLRRAEDGPLRAPRTALSTGCAAGPSKQAATIRGLLELIERDAAALWWSGARKPAAVPTSDRIEGIIRDLRGSASGRKTWLLDISSDIAIPVVAALACDAEQRNLAVGIAARCTFEAAGTAALVELCQMELGLQLARLKADRRGPLTDDDERHLARGRINVASEARLNGVAQCNMRSAVPGLDELAHIITALDAQHIEATIVDLTRPDIGVPTVKTIAPRLQPLPSGFLTPRLAAALQAGGTWPPAIPLH
ncbi:YcaO-like family protein [Variibacter gotjawalensis]|uniref:YcaO-like family protein n=1 Tax=Variibacter gotjawalensis TaxID=1333996 RepID=A0A0S3PZX1_9BRAD|nr:YcaO-like family protein [Variibacter gotjawalensis]NIK47311.1 ribosomal protein S12 methylthiotransferase accessory factor [Variibacter gotjawalensis]RZS49209.1 ribosomal protein S12 methylthiotransferase accessory factor [Variibacter gotjawalensis]BAT61471.1 YcaO-like family protein [Variibacter gotjawalensis]